jgi:FlaA1/EpsC-like NDP-sugar epimerase
MSLLSFSIALALRYSVTNYNFLDHIPNLLEKVVILLVTQQAFFLIFGLYRGLWRFSSTHDLKQIIKAAFFSSLVTFILFELTGNRDMIPRSSMVIYFSLLILTAGGGRFLYRILKESKESKSSEEDVPVLIVGAGNAAEQLIRDFNRQILKQYKIVGLVDDDQKKQKRTIHGIKVLGNSSQLSNLLKKYSILKVFIAIPSAGSADVRRIVAICNSHVNIDVKILPSVQDIINNKVSISSLRQVNPIDLLGRDPVELNINLIGEMLSNKNILISGAAGSIGSELTKQILKFKPANLYLLDVSEYFLYELERKLTGYKLHTNIIPIIGDIRNKKRLEWIFSNYKVSSVYHAAAYKHVPLMEINPTEAIETNIFGTKNLAEAAIEGDVDTFVMVSTDKAVNPTNVMGTTKRIAEMVCQQLSHGRTQFTTVRFGNVLGSNGSVIPLFEEQIKNGGPVTITHKDMTRFFMSIPEAAQLILQAAIMGKGSEIFILDMGEPIKIYNFAEQMIKLSGLEPIKDIDIKITGLRPGEKLYEELLANDENTIKTSHSKVRVASGREVPKDILSYLEKLASKLHTSTLTEIKYILQECVEEYTPDIKNE